MTRAKYITSNLQSYDIMKENHLQRPSMSREGLDRYDLFGNAEDDHWIYK